MKNKVEKETIEKLALENGYLIVDEEYKKEYPILHPIVERIEEDLFRTTIPEVGDVFTGSLRDTIDVLELQYENVCFDYNKFILDNCEQLSLEDFLEFRKNCTMLEKWSLGDDVRYRCENKIFLCKNDENIDMQINQAESDIKYDTGYTIKWEKRNNKNIKESEVK